jgi:hypothetical protein
LPHGNSTAASVSSPKDEYTIVPNTFLRYWLRAVSEEFFLLSWIVQATLGYVEGKGRRAVTLPTSFSVIAQETERGRHATERAAVILDRIGVIQRTGGAGAKPIFRINAEMLENPPLPVEELTLIVKELRQALRKDIRHLKDHPTCPETGQVPLANTAQGRVRNGTGPSSETGQVPRPKRDSLTGALKEESKELKIKGNTTSAPAASSTSSSSARKTVDDADDDDGNALLHPKPPRTKPYQPITANPDLISYTERIRCLLKSRHCVKNSFGPADKKLAEELFHEQIPIEQIEHGFLLVFQRWHVAFANGKDLGLIRSLKYFESAIREAGQPELAAVSEAYWRYLEHRLDPLDRQYLQKNQTSAASSSASASEHPRCAAPLSLQESSPTESISRDAKISPTDQPRISENGISAASSAAREAEGGEGHGPSSSIPKNNAPAVFEFSPEVVASEEEEKIFERMEHHLTKSSGTVRLMLDGTARLRIARAVSGAGYTLAHLEYLAQWSVVRKAQNPIGLLIKIAEDFHNRARSMRWPECFICKDSGVAAVKGSPWNGQGPCSCPAAEKVRHRFPHFEAWKLARAEGREFCADCANTGYEIRTGGEFPCLQCDFGREIAKRHRDEALERSKQQRAAEDRLRQAQQEKEKEQWDLRMGHISAQTARAATMRKPPGSPEFRKILANIAGGK